MSSDIRETPQRTRRRLIFILPVAVFVVLAAAFAWQLASGDDPSELPSARIGDAMPEFTLPPINASAQGLSSADIKGEVALVNFFASWCLPCRAEHGLLMDLARRGVVPIYGVDYKDDPEDGWKWLQDLGDPFARTGSDRDGRVAIDFGVYGVPETYVIDRDGVIRHRHVGPLTERDLEKLILPLIERLRG